MARTPGWKRAGQYVRSAIKKGLLRPAKGRPCSDCGALADVYDHRDYNYPLEIEAVCFKCNKRRGKAIPHIAAPSNKGLVNGRGGVYFEADRSRFYGRARIGGHRYRTRHTKTRAEAEELVRQLLLSKAS